MAFPRDKNIEVLRHRSGKGPHHNKKKDIKHLRKRFKEKLRQLIRFGEKET